MRSTKSIHIIGCHAEGEVGDVIVRHAKKVCALLLLPTDKGRALNTIRRSRIAGLPEAMVDERYLLEARALSEMGRAEQALELTQITRLGGAEQIGLACRGRLRLLGAAY